MIENVAREVEVGKTYSCKVVSIQEFGAFVELWPGCEGLVHISNLAWRRVAKVEDEVKEGDEIVVKLIEVGNVTNVIGSTITLGYFEQEVPGNRKSDILKL